MEASRRVAEPVAATTRAPRTGEGLTVGPMAPVLVAAASLLFTAVYVVMGAGYVLDDWYTLANGRLDGATSAVAADQWRARPGTGVVSTLVFGPLGGHPGWTAMIQGLVSAATAALLVVTARRFVSPGRAAAIGLFWAVLPTHTSLVMWPSAANIGLSTLLGVAAVRWLADERRSRHALALIALAIGILCYEALAPFAAAVTLAVPWVRRRRPDVSLTFAGAVVIGGATGWILLHWNSSKDLKHTPDLGLALTGHFGEGAVGVGTMGVVVAGLAAVGMFALVWSAVRRDEGASLDRDAWLLLAGLAVIVVGLVPFARYFYAPFGPGDRFHFVSGIGGAMCWTALLARTVALRRDLGYVVGAGLLILGAAAHVRQASVWHRGGADAEEILDAIVARWPEPPDERIVLGPAPIIEAGVAPFVSRSNLEYALRYRYGTTDVRAGVAHHEDDFATVPEALRVEIGPLSSLNPDD